MWGLPNLCICFIVIAHLYYCASQLPCYDPGHLMPWPGQCNRYYDCVKNENDDLYPVSEYCSPTTLHFSPYHKRCVEADLALCAAEFKSLQCTSDNQLLGHPTNCSRYFRCQSMRPMVESCQPNLHFSKRLERCVAPIEALCDETLNFNCTDYIFDNPNRPTLLPHPTNCGAFFKCFNGLAMEMYCPNFLYFSTTLQRCEYPFYVDCRNGVRRSFF